jgi:hypothetical protein
VWWLIPIILDTLEVEIATFRSEDDLDKGVRLYLKNKLKQKVGVVTQVLGGPEFSPSYPLKREAET